jgi:predicted nucleic acid-binding protein
VFVLDVSVSLAWCFHDEGTAQTWAVLDRLRQESAVVPSLWHLETANVLTLAERRGRLSEAAVQRLPIAVDPETSERALREILILARGEELTSYDAAYLELALRSGLPLAIKDRILERAACRMGVVLLPTSGK